MPVNVRAFGNYWPVLLKLGCLVLLILAANVVADLVVEALNFEIRPSNEDLVHRTIVTAAIAYVLLIAVPFVPGVEIGVALIGVFGPPIVFLVYLCTLTGLALSFLIGRLIPARFLIVLFDSFKLHRLGGLLRTLPIRLTPMTATCRVPPLSRVKLGIGWSRGVARDAEQ